MRLVMFRWGGWGSFAFRCLFLLYWHVTTVSDLPCAHGVSSGACFGWLAHIMPSLHHPFFYLSLLRFVSFRFDIFDIFSFRLT